MFRVVTTVLESLIPRRDTEFVVAYCRIVDGYLPGSPETYSNARHRAAEIDYTTIGRYVVVATLRQHHVSRLP
jgi:hypothetical protein